MAQADVDALPALLRSSGPEREAAYAALRDLLVRAALAYLVRQRYPLQSFGADSYETLAEDFAQEALATIVRQLDTFRGDSRFTTWAYRIVVNLMADEYRRRAWRRRPLEAAPPERLDGRPDREGPERSAERRETWALIDEVIRDELTPRQRQVLVGRIFEEKPLIVLADELGTDKDNVYKLLHDARKHLKRALLARGVALEDLLDAFEER